MPVDVVMPKLGLTMTEGVLAKWLVPDGARVEKGQPLLAVETAKAVVESPSPASGVLRQTTPAGATVPVMGVVGQLLEAEEVAATAPAALPPEPAAPVAEVPPEPQVERVPVRRESYEPVCSAPVQEAGTVTISTDADATALMAAKARLDERLAGSPAPDEDLLAKLVARCLREFPNVRLRIERDLTARAASTGAGLVAEEADRGAGSAAPDSAVLTVGSVTYEPVVVGGTIVVRPVIALSLAYDAGLLDRATAARLLWRLRQLVEEPLLAL